MKVCFIYDPEPNQKFIDIMSKMTPGRSGQWKDMIATPNEDEADFFVVIDTTSRKLDPKRTIYVSAHPYMEGYSGYSPIDETKCIAKLDLKETFGFGEWWLKYDYDYLSALNPPTKTKHMCCIMTNASGGFGRDDRKRYIAKIEKLYPSVNIYGRIIKDGIGKGELGQNTPDAYWFGKEDVLAAHRYSIEIDVGATKHYFSERVFDSLLMWCMPLYWGGTNVEEYLPKECFSYIDIYGNGDDLFGNKYDVKAIAEARQLILNKYQLWARVYETIKQL